MSLIEIVVAMAIVILFSTSFVALVGSNYGRMEIAKDQSQATLLSQEAVTVLKTIAADAWPLIVAATGDPSDENRVRRGITETAGVYVFTGEPDSFAAADAPVFTRSITIDPVYRDPDTHSIIPPEEWETYDEEEAFDLEDLRDEKSRLATVTVEWTNERKQPSSIETTVLLTDWYVHSILFDTEEDFLGDQSAADEWKRGLFHNASPVKELFNGELRLLAAGNMGDPDVTIGPITVEGSNGTQARGMHVTNDDLFLATDNQILRYSLENISRPGGTPELKKVASVTIPSGATISAFAADDEAMYIGDTAGNVFKIWYETFASGTYNWTELRNARRASDDKPNLPYDGNGLGINALYITPARRLYVARQPQTDTSTSFELFSLTENFGVFAQLDLGQERIVALAADDAHVYIATEKRVYAYDVSDGTTISFLGSANPFLDSQSMTTMMLDGRWLWLGATETSEHGEIVRIDVSDPSVLLPETHEIGTNAAHIFRPTGTSWIAVTTDTTDRKILLLSTEGSLHEHAPPVSIPDVTGFSCRAIDYEIDRLFFACENSAGDVVMHAIEGKETPVQHGARATYVSPVRCADGTVAQWTSLAFRENGEGLISLRLRSGEEPTSSNNLAEIDAKPWSDSLETDTTWHDLTALSPALSGPCIQFQAVFSASPLCPLFLENVTITHD